MQYKILILFICCIIGLVIHNLNNNTSVYEYFATNTGRLILQASLWNFSEWTNSHKNWSVGSFNNDKWESVVKNIQNNTINNIVSTNDQVCLLCDPLAKDIYFPNSIEIKETIPSGYFTCFIRSDKINTFDCSYNFENKTIGYIDISDYYFIQAIIQSYRMNPEKIKLQQINSTDVQSIEFILTTSYIDMLITYIIPDSLVIKYIQLQRVAIVGFSTLDFDRVSLFYPYIKPKEVSLKSIFVKTVSSKVSILDKYNETILPEMTMKLINIQNSKKSSTPSAAIKETFITRLNFDETSLDPNYRCFGDMIVESKAQCNSIYDITGNRKDYPTQWDKPCTSNQDCPFYKKNKYYSNNRGGCLENGYCEMPIGVLQASPHVYYDTGKFQPFCYGCTPGNDPDCCKITSDYAFPNDTTERSMNGLKTSISLM